MEPSVFHIDDPFHEANHQIFGSIQKILGLPFFSDGILKLKVVGSGCFDHTPTSGYLATSRFYGKDDRDAALT